MHNTDTSTHKLDNQIPGDMLGALVVEWKGHTFKIGTGFDNAQRRLIWRKRERFKGTLAKFKYQELSKYGIPRFPVWLEMRHKEDLS